MTDRLGTPSAGPELAPAEPGASPATPDDPPHFWAEADRPRGLDAWFAPGGEDDAPPERIADERRLVRLLAVMIALLVGVPLLLTAIAFVVELASRSSG